MGFWSFFDEFIDIIEWLDESQDTILYRFKRQGNEIKNGAKLIVRESQTAVLVDGGQIADMFGPGTYTLSTENIPVLSKIRGWMYGFNSPFKCEVYFVNTKNFLDQKWGTKNPIMLRDPEFGPIRLRAFGTYTFKIQDAAKFIEDVAGTNDEFTTDDITGQLRNVTVSRLASVLAESNIPVLDLAANYDELSKFIHKKIAPEFREYGIDLTKFLVENISLPAEVEEVLDKRTSMGIIGDLSKYTQFQAAEAMEEAAKNPGGDASSGIGAGIGFVIANEIAKSMKMNSDDAVPTTERVVTPPPPPLPPQLQVFVAQNGEQTGPFNAMALKELIKTGKLTTDTLVWKEGMKEWLTAENVDEIVTLLNSVPPAL